MTNSGVDPARRLVLDTSAYTRMRAGHGTVLDRVAAAEVVLIPATVLGELEAGFQLGSRFRENSVVLEEFLSEPFVATLPTTPEVARRYGRLFADLRRAGTPISINAAGAGHCTLAPELARNGAGRLEQRKDATMRT